MATVVARHKRGAPTAGEWLWVAELTLGQHKENAQLCARRRVPLWTNGTDELLALRDRARAAGVEVDDPYEFVTDDNCKEET